MYKIRLILHGVKIFVYSEIIGIIKKVNTFFIKHNKNLSARSVVYTARVQERLMMKLSSEKGKYNLLIFELLLNKRYYN